MLADSEIVKTTEYKPTSFWLSAASVSPVGHLRISFVDHTGNFQYPSVPSTARPPAADRKALGSRLLAMGKAGPPDDHRPKNFSFGMAHFLHFRLFSFAVGDTVFLREPETPHFAIPVLALRLRVRLDLTRQR